MTERVAWLLTCALIFTIPWEKSLYVPGLGTGARVLGIAAFATGALAALARRGVRAPNLAMAAAALYVTWGAATWFWSYDPPATIARAATLIQLLAMAYLVWDLCRTEPRQAHVMAAYVAGSVVAAIATMVRYAQNFQTYYRRYAAPGFDPNDLGLTLALSIPLALYLALRTGGWKAWMYRGAVALASAAILLTASRTALVVTCLGFAFTLWTWRESDRVQRAASVGLLVLLVAGAVWLAPAPARQRISTLGTELARGTLHNRTQIWKSGLKAFKQRPIRGVGLGAYPDAVRPWLGVPGVPGHEYVAHNTFLSVLVETGIIGFAMFAAALVTAAIFVCMMRDTERALWFTVLAVWAAGAATLTWEHRKPTWLVFALIMTEWARAFMSASSRPAAGRVILVPGEIHDRN